MAIIPFQKLVCPLDSTPLNFIDVSWSCAHGHNFDVSKQGYVNLLPVQHKRSIDPGDHKSMVAARQRFLNAGFYKPIADAVSQQILSGWESANIFSCLDAGSGEGYYLRELASAASEGSLALLGLDISKWAVLAAAKQDSRPNWVVASNAKLPVESNSLDCVLCMFGFPAFAEFNRVLKPGGMLVQVDSGADHLQELRNIIYPSQKQEKRLDRDSLADFSEVARDSVKYALDLDSNADIADLLAMTPHYYRINAEGHSKVAALTEITVTVDVKITQSRSV